MSTTLPESPPTDAVRRRGVSVTGSDQEEAVGLFDLLNPLLRQPRIVVGFPLALAALATLVGLLIRPTYTASTTFIPETKPQAALPQGLAGLAGQLGLSLPQTPGQSPRFYAQVLRSREIMERVLLARYPVRGAAGESDSASLLAILHVRGRDSADSLAKALEELDRHLDVSVDAQTNIVTLSVGTRDPALSAAVANRFIAYLNEFNTQHRESQARERRRFAEQRVTEADAELRRAEEAVKTFYERNRGWQESPSLGFAEAELRRQVSVGQEVYLTLRREFEMARIEEVNDTPVITVIDVAVPPSRKSWPRVPLLALLALVVGTMAGAVWAYLADYVSRARREEDRGYQEFIRLLGQARRGLGGLFRRRSQR